MPVGVAITLVKGNMFDEEDVRKMHGKIDSFFNLIFVGLTFIKYRY